MKKRMTFKWWLWMLLIGFAGQVQGTQTTNVFCDFSAGAEPFYPQTGTNAWKVISGEYVYTGTVATVGASTLTNQEPYLEKSIYTRVKVSSSNQIAMIAFAYTGDIESGSQYFLCAGIYKGRWAVGIYNMDYDNGIGGNGFNIDGFKLVRSYDFYGSFWYGRSVVAPNAPQTNTAYTLRIDLEGATARLFVNDTSNGHILPYLQNSFASIPEHGALGVIAVNTNSGGRIYFDNFSVRSRARTVTQEAVKFPFSRNFDGEDALAGLSFSSPQCAEVTNGQLHLNGTNSFEKAVYEGLSGNNWRIECDLAATTNCTNSSYIGIVVGYRGEAGSLYCFINENSFGISMMDQLYSCTSTISSALNFNVYDSAKLIVESKGADISVEISKNGISQNQTWRVNPFTIPSIGAGSVGVFVKNTSATFDNFKVSPLQVTSLSDTNVTAVELKAHHVSEDKSMISKVLEQYEYDPVRIYEHIHNEIQTTPETSSILGAEGTLSYKKGGVLDQCSALIALLRRCGIPCRYVVGALSMRAGDWERLYGFPTSDSRGIRLSADMPYTEICWWVQARIYENGVTSVVDLFPWVKFYENKEKGALSMEDILYQQDALYPNAIGHWPVNTNQPVAFDFLEKYIANDPELFPVNEKGQLIYGSDRPSIILKKILENNLQSSGADQSFDQTGMEQRILPVYADSLLKVRPPEILSAVPDSECIPYLHYPYWDIIPLEDIDVAIKAGLDDFSGANKNNYNAYVTYHGDELRKKVSVSLSDANGIGLQTNFYTSELINNRLILKFDPVNSAFSNAIPGTTKAKPVLLLNGVTSAVWTNSATYPKYCATTTSGHNELTLSLSNVVRGVTSANFTASVRVGNLECIAFDFAGLSDEMFDMQQGRYLESSKDLTTNLPAFDAANYEAVYGNLLQLIGCRYFQQLNRACNEWNPKFLVKQTGVDSASRFFQRIEQSGTNLIMGDFHMDFKYNTVTLKVLDPSSESAIFKNLTVFTGAEISAYEHGVFFDSYGAANVASTMKCLNEIPQQGGSVRLLTKSNLSTNKSFVDAADTNYSGTISGLYSICSNRLVDSESRIWMPSKAMTNGPYKSLGYYVLQPSEGGCAADMLFSCKYITP